VLGGDREVVIASLAKHGLTPANENGAGQIVAAGTMEQLEALAAEGIEGSRMRALDVAGAFHTNHMAPAVDVLASHARAISTHDARVPLLSNADGQIVHNGREVLTRLVTQVSNPVRWDLCMQAMVDMGVTGLIELPPAGTLAGLAKRAMPGVEIVSLKTPEDIAAAADLIKRHARNSGMDTSPSWRLVVSPAKGTFRRIDVEPGASLGRDATVGSVDNLRESVPVMAPHGGVLIEWLAEDGDPVSPGQGLARLHPEGS
jgi:[acyl-carrier-protein] S-malonyltransferase